MTRFIKSDRNQVMLFSRKIGDNLGENHEVYAFATLLDTIDMSSFLCKYSKEGGKAYHPSVMLGCLLYGFHRGWRSSRELQKACEENDAMRYLVGDNKIKFRSLADFRVRFGKEIEKVFDHSVSLLCHTKKNIGTDVKVDGTKIKASAADDQTYKLSDLKKYKETLKKEILDFLRSGIELDTEEDKLYGKHNSGYEINPEDINMLIQDFIHLQEEAKKTKKENEVETPEFSDHSSLDVKKETAKDTQESVKLEEQSISEESKRAKESVQVKEPEDTSKKEDIMLRKTKKYIKIDKTLAEAEKTSSASLVPDRVKVNLTDPDARFMKRNGKISQSYNVQVASSEGYIIAADVAEGNSENDLEQLAPTLSKAELNIENDMKTVSADSGYFHSSGLAYLDSKQIDGFIPSPNQTAKERKGKEDSGYEDHYFNYDEDDDSWLCPESKTLEFHNESVKDGRKYTHYHGKPSDCVICPSRNGCCTSKEELRRGYRTLSVDSGFALKHEMINKMHSEEAKSFYKKRGSEVEPIFGILKQARKFRELLLRGKDKVQIEVKIAATAFNFGKMIREQLV